MSEKKDHAFMHWVGNIFGFAVCLILLPILLVNVVLIVKSLTNQGQIPSVGGYLPLIVLTDSMYPSIQSGDLIVCKSAEAKDIKVGDVIAFFDPAGDGTSVVSHRVTEIVTEDGELSFRTQGDANNVEDEDLVPAENLVGVFAKRIPKAGNVAMFMQTSSGLVVCVVIPMMLLIGYDLLRRKSYEKNRDREAEKLRKELMELKAQKM